MTTDLEKKFFETFGVEPKYENICKLSEKCFNNKDLTNKRGAWHEYMKSNGCAYEIFGFCIDECKHVYSKERYPQITDTHYLKLICLITKELNYFTNFSTNYEHLKEYVLKEMILHKDDFSKSQVQELFKE